MNYVDTLTNEQRKNIDALIDAAKKNGITNPHSQAAFLAIISKESKFMPINENMNYSAGRIGEVWPRLASRAQSLAGNPQKLGDAAYGNPGNHLGNAPNEGYKYRGRGFNQITGKANYTMYAKLTGNDIVNNPDLMLNPKVAAEVAVAFAKRNIGKLKTKGKLSSYNANDINDFKNEKDALMAFYHANAGTGKPVSYVKNLEHNDHLGGFTKALKRISDLHVYAIAFVKKKTSSDHSTSSNSCC